jgi:predicted DNA-binding transcriptional regulator AlpA
MGRIQRILRQKELRSYDGLGRDTKRDELIARGEYPPPFKLSEGGRTKAWWESEVLAWQRWRKARQEGKAAPGSSWRDYLDQSDFKEPTADDRVQGK